MTLPLGIAGQPTALSRRAVLVGTAFACASGGAYALTPRASEQLLGKTKLGALIPAKIGAWRSADRGGVVVATDEEGAPADGYDQVLTRTYVADGLPDIMLLLAYGSTQGGSLRLHRPETCYPAQGFALGDFGELRFRFGPQGTPVAARRFTASRDDRIERVVYWTRVANSFPLDTAELYAAILRSTIKGIVPDGILVRFSSIGPNPLASDAALSQFAYDMVGDSAAQGRRLVLGNAIG